jgi:hypothetical protein
MTKVSIRTDADLNRLFKSRYLPISNDVYANYDSILSRIEKQVGGFGEALKRTHTLTLPGSVGAGNGSSLPTANIARTVQPSWDFKTHHAVAFLDNATIENSKSDADAMVSILDNAVAGALLSNARNRVRNFLNDSTGVLGQFSGSATNTAGGVAQVNVEVTILNTGRYRRRTFHLEPRDYVFIGLGAATPPFVTPPLASKFEIESYNRETGLLRLNRVDGATDLTTIGAGTWNIYMQNSFNLDRTGLLDICFNTTVNGVAKQNRYTPFVIPGTTDSDVGGAELDISMLTSIVDRYSSETQQEFTDIVLSPVVYRKFKNLISEKGLQFQDVQVRPNVPGQSEEITAKLGMSAIKYFGIGASTVIQQHRLLRDDMALFLNRNHIAERCVTAPGWFDDDGTIFLRVPGTNYRAAHYNSYGEFIIHPYHVGFIQGLNTSEVIL